MNMSSAFYRREKCCTNCGKFGHLKRKCIEPIISLGIICFKNDPETDKLLYLMVMRKHTIAFIDFIRGHYRLNDIPRLNYLFKYMTPDEKDFIVKNDFHFIWKSIWLITESKRFIKECNDSVVKFNKIKKGYLFDYTFVTFDHLINHNPSINDVPSWGFPKGRRNNYETDIDTAQREFNEESGYLSSDYHILNDIPKITENFIGTNSYRYRYVYYVGRCISRYTPIIDPNNNMQVTEIGDIRWYSFEKCIEIFKNYQNTDRRIELLTDINDRLLNRYLSIDTPNVPYKKFIKHDSLFNWNDNHNNHNNNDNNDNNDNNTVINDDRDPELNKAIDMI
jgi:8-oxo-dGTP pyrophosphatase MutT (NUDIX family)